MATTHVATNTTLAMEEPQLSPETTRGPLPVEIQTEPQLRRSRSLSSTANALLESAEGEAQPESPIGSVDQAEDEVNPYPQRERPRSEPTVVDGKYVCTQCAIKPFDRRCEWK